MSKIQSGLMSIGLLGMGVIFNIASIVFLNGWIPHSSGVVFGVGLFVLALLCYGVLLRQSYRHKKENLNQISHTI